MGLRLQRRARRGRTGRNRKARKRRDGSSLLDRVHLRTGGHDAQAAARRDSRGGLETPREPQRVGSRGGDRAGRGEGSHGEGTRSGRARHAAAPRARWCHCLCGVPSAVGWCWAFRRVGETGRQERVGWTAGLHGPRAEQHRVRSSWPASRRKLMMGLVLGLGWRSLLVSLQHSFAEKILFTSSKYHKSLFFQPQL